MARDEREVRQRLGVLHERRAPAEPALGRPGRADGRDRSAPLERLDEGRLLAGQERLGDRLDADMAPVAALGDGGTQRCAGGDRPRGDGHHDVVGADRGGGGGRAVEDEVRDPLEQHAVLRAHGLALGAVDDDDLAAAARGDGGQLRRGGERRAAAPAKRRLLAGTDEVTRPGRRRAVDRQVAAQVDDAVASHPGQDARQGRAGRAGRHPGTPRSGRARTVPVTWGPATSRARSTRSARPSRAATSARSTVPSSLVTRPR